MKDVLKNSNVYDDILSEKKGKRNFRHEKSCDVGKIISPPISSSNTRSYRDVYTDKDKSYRDVLYTFNLQCDTLSDIHKHRRSNSLKDKHKNINEYIDNVSANTHSPQETRNITTENEETQETVIISEIVSDYHDEHSKSKDTYPEKSKKHLLNDSIIKYVKPAIPKDLMRNKIPVNIPKYVSEQKLLNLQSARDLKRENIVQEEKLVCC